MKRSKIKVIAKARKKGETGTLIARVPVAVSRTDKPKGEMIYRTRAQITAHIRHGSRPAKTQFRRVSP